jgi:hypothetical protein
MGLRAQYPDADEVELKYQACRIRYGDEIAQGYRAALVAYIAAQAQPATGT